MAIHIDKVENYLASGKVPLFAQWERLMHVNSVIIALPLPYIFLLLVKVGHLGHLKNWSHSASICRKRIKGYVKAFTQLNWLFYAFKIAMKVSGIKNLKLLNIFSFMRPNSAISGPRKRKRAGTRPWKPTIEPFRSFMYCGTQISMRKSPDNMFHEDP